MRYMPPVSPYAPPARASNADDASIIDRLKRLEESVTALANRVESLAARASNAGPANAAPARQEFMPCADPYAANADADPAPMAFVTLDGSGRSSAILLD